MHVVSYVLIATDDVNDLRARRKPISANGLDELFWRCKNSKTVLASSPALSSNNFCTLSQTSMNGSGRVRPRTADGNSLGNRSRRRYFRAVLASIPALDAKTARKYR